MVEVTDSSSVSTTEKPRRNARLFFYLRIFRHWTAQRRKKRNALGRDAPAIKTKRLGGYPSILTSIFRRSKQDKAAGPKLYKSYSESPRTQSCAAYRKNYLAVESTTTLAAESAGMATAAGSAIVSAGAATSAGFA